MVKGHLIASFEEVSVFLERIRSFDSNSIDCSDHAFFRLSEKQRKVFTCEKIKDYLLNQTPLKVGIQNNGNFAVFYNYGKTTVIKIIIDMRLTLINTVTFYIIDRSRVPG